jgi:hypothetical protein
VEPIKARRFECRSVRVTGGHARLRGQIPRGAAVEVEQGPQDSLGMRPEIRRIGTARRPRPPSRSDPRKKLRGPSSTLRRSLFRPTTRHPSTIRSEPAPPSAGAGVRVERRKVFSQSSSGDLLNWREEILEHGESTGPDSKRPRLRLLCHHLSRERCICPRFRRQVQQLLRLF